MSIANRKLYNKVSHTTCQLPLQKGYVVNAKRSAQTHQKTPSQQLQANVGLIPHASNDNVVSHHRLAVCVAHDLLVCVLLHSSVQDANLVSHGLEETANQLSLLGGIIVREVLVGVLREGRDLVVLLALRRKGSREGEVVVDVANLTTKVL